MLEEYNKSVPKVLQPITESELEYWNSLSEDIRLDFICGKVDWHLPFGDKMPKDIDNISKLKISVARAARLSYETFDGEISVKKDFEIYENECQRRQDNYYKSCS